MLFPAFLIALAGCAAVQAEQLQGAALEWARSASRGVHEEEFLEDVTRSARVIAFGEAVHESEELLSLRNQLFQLGVEQFGVTAIAAETGYADSIAVDDFVLGKGKVTKELVAAVFSFGAPDAMQKNWELIQWMRDYNTGSGAKRKLRFYGIEALGRYDPQAQAYARPPFEAAVDFVASRNAEKGAHFRQLFEPLLDKLTSQGYVTFEQTERDRLTLAAADLVRLYERRRIEWASQTSEREYQRGYRNARNAQNLDADLRAMGWWVSRTGDRNQRDVSSAESVLWTLRQEGGDSRVFLFAHNEHVRACPETESKNRFSSLGQHLRATLDDQYVAIGSIYDNGPSIEEEGGVSVNSLLSSVGTGPFALDMREVAHEGAARVWWDQTQRVYQSSKPYSVNPANCFDALIYVEEVNPAQHFEGS